MLLCILKAGDIFSTDGIPYIVFVPLVYIVLEIGTTRAFNLPRDLLKSRWIRQYRLYWCCKNVNIQFS